MTKKNKKNKAKRKYKADLTPTKKSSKVNTIILLAITVVGAGAVFFLSH